MEATKADAKVCSEAAKGKVSALSMKEVDQTTVEIGQPPHGTTDGSGINSDWPRQDWEPEAEANTSSHLISTCRPCVITGCGHLEDNGDTDCRGDDGHNDEVLTEADDRKTYR